MANPLERSIQRAEAANEHIGRLFTYLGVENPQGIVNKAYRNAYRGLDHALQEEDPIQAAKEVLDHLKVALAALLLALLKDAGDWGKDEAIHQLRDYGIKPPAKSSVDLSTQTDAALAAIMADVDKQDLTAQALIQAGAGREEIIGSAQRRGVLLASSVIAVAGRFAASMVWQAFDAVVAPLEGVEQVGGWTLEKMAVATIDDRTTECCLLVHGQVQPLSAPFQLIGDPHFASEMDRPPFHWHCRTSVALYASRFDGGIRERMRQAAQALEESRNGRANRAGYTAQQVQ